jgi:hypothetical protein
MKMLVKYGQMPNITEPVAPENRLNAVEMKRWEAKLESHKVRVQKIGKHKAMVFGLIYLKCSKVIQKIWNGMKTMQGCKDGDGG